MHRPLLLLLTVCVLQFSQKAYAEDIKLQLLCEQHMPPLSYWKQGKPAGFVVNLLQDMLKDMGREEEIKTYPWSRAYFMGLHDPGTLICAIARTPKRENLFKWVGEVFNAPMVLLALKERGGFDLQEGDLDAIKNYKVATLRKTYGEEYLLDQGFSLGKNILSLSTPYSAYKSLITGRADLWLVNHTFAKAAIEEVGADFSLLKTVSVVDSLTSTMYMAFQKDTPDSIVEQFRASLEKYRGPSNCCEPVQK